MKKKEEEKEGKKKMRKQEHEMEKWRKLCLCRRALQAGRWSNRLLEARVTVTRA